MKASIIAIRSASKLTGILLIIVLVFLLSACGDDSSPLPSPQAQLMQGVASTPCMENIITEKGNISDFQIYFNDCALHAIDTVMQIINAVASVSALISFICPPCRVFLAGLAGVLTFINVNIALMLWDSYRCNSQGVYLHAGFHIGYSIVPVCKIT